MNPILAACDASRLRTLPAGETLLAEGKSTGRLYVLAAGKLQVLRGETEVAVIAEPGAVVGEMAILLGTPHTASVRTLTEVKAYAYEDAEGFLRSDPAVTFAVAQLLAQRLNSATGYLADLKRQYAHEGNHLGMVSDILASLINQPKTDFEPGSEREPGSAP